MANIPNSKPQASKEDVIEMLIEQGVWSNREVTKLSLVAVRGYYLDSMGRKGRNDRGIYDDALFLISPDTFTSFNANTDPSVYRSGRAVLEAPQRVVYRPGYHGYNSKRGHYAFRQASDVIVRRDGGIGNGRNLGDGRFTDQGHNRFWINLHRGGWSTTSSAGCQTIPPNQWDALYSLVRLQLKRYRQSSFSYYLIDNA